MSNVTTGDLAWITRATSQPHLLGRIVSVGRRYMGEPFFDTLGRPAVFDDFNSVTDISWYVTLQGDELISIDLRAAGEPKHLGVAQYPSVPWADVGLRRIAGPSVDTTEDTPASISSPEPATL